MKIPVDIVIDYSKENRRHRVNGFFVIFFAALFAAVAIFVTAGISRNELCETVVSTKEETANSSDVFQDIRYTFVDGKLVKEYLSDEEIAAENEHILEMKKEEEERKREKEKKESEPEYVPPEGAKIVYLTFDDGPSEYTGKLLDVLNKYNVKVTFFVTCSRANHRDMIKRAYDEGHSIGLHSCSHNYSKIYVSDDAFYSDLGEVSSVVKDLTGEESKLLRFPGGSSNLASKTYSKGIMSRLTDSVTAKGYRSFDWNVSSGDADNATNSDMVYNNIVYNLKGDYSIVLQHDTKEFSVDAVERIIKFGLDNGFTFKALNVDSPTAHHGVNN